jgi:small-conductance mechanosensitive channel
MNPEDIKRLALSVAVAAGIGSLGWLLRRFVLGRLARLLHRTSTDLDELFLAVVRPHVPFWFVLLGIVVAVRYGYSGSPLVGVVDKGALAAFFLSLTLVAASFLARVVESRSKRWPGRLPATSLTQNAVRIVVIGLGSLVVLGNLGIAITPLLTALGVGSLAVALALQPTLSNLFAGFHVTLAQKIRPGDFVQLETGQEGYVVDIGWRSTQIRELPNNLIIVPNARIAEIIVKNYAMPETRQAALVQVGVSYGSDLEQVEQVTIDTAREVQRSVPGAVPEFEPFIRYHTFGDSSINFTVILQVEQFVDRYLVTHEFMKRLQRTYAHAGIEIPFPQRVLHVRGLAGVGAPGAGT